jgi:hypothetical protein
MRKLKGNHRRMLASGSGINFVDEQRAPQETVTQANAVSVSALPVGLNATVGNSQPSSVNNVKPSNTAYTVSSGNQPS